MEILFSTNIYFNAKQVSSINEQLLHICIYIQCIQINKLQLYIIYVINSFISTAVK